jgi:DNA-binding winged helix-turn-helix (wHTH) protein
MRTKDRTTVEINGARVHVTGKEYQMLELLALRKGIPLTKEMFLNRLYGGMDEPEAKIIDVFICKLRKKLAGASGGKDYIETVWGRGYVMRELAEVEATLTGPHAGRSTSSGFRRVSGATASRRTVFPQNRKHRRCTVNRCFQPSMRIKAAYPAVPLSSPSRFAAISRAAVSTGKNGRARTAIFVACEDLE